MGKSIYCQFSFRRPKGEEYGYFSVVFYRDKECTDTIGYKTIKERLWVNNQFITAIQSFEVALRVISENQGKLINAGVDKVYLVIDNRLLIDWILNPNKSKRFKRYISRAFKNYRFGGDREITIGVGLCGSVSYNKAYKYCNEKYIKDESVKVEKVVSVLDILSMEGGDSE
ncbi:MAG: hypothetical protein QXD03_05320 [Candidatus Anstonellales archaeon]